MVDQEIDTLARTMYGEAVAHNDTSALAVGFVVMNRTNYPNWPNTPRAVCMQPWQFSCWNQNDPNRARILAATEDKNQWFARCVELAKQVYYGQSVDFTRGATHYYATYVPVPKWAKGHKPCFENAPHLFFNDIDTPAPRTAAEALDQVRPISSTRTVRGGQLLAGTGAIATVSGAASTLAPALPVLNFVKDNIGFSLMILGVAILIGAGVVVWARIDDRVKGLR